MGIFGNLFGTKENDTPAFNWIPLTEMSQLDEIIANSHKTTQVIFKHSTRCIISRSAIKNFEAEYNQELNLELYYLDLLNHRDISDLIATKFNVMHQSPQVLVIKHGVCSYSETHEYIDATLLENYQ